MIVHLKQIVENTQLSDANDQEELNLGFAGFKDYDVPAGIHTAKEALDWFHKEQPIGCPEDYDIWVIGEDNQVLIEDIGTVNVLTLSGGVPQAIKSWPETPEGNKSAEQYFKSLIKNVGCPEEDLEAATEDGTYEAEPTGYDFFLTHSD
jgi:hypothetical protein